MGIFTRISYKAYQAYRLPVRHLSVQPWSIHGTDLRSLVILGSLVMGTGSLEEYEATRSLGIRYRDHQPDLGMGVYNSSVAKSGLEGRKEGIPARCILNTTVCTPQVLQNRPTDYCLRHPRHPCSGTYTCSPWTFTGSVIVPMLSIP
jgi:hypothetical protein